MKHEYEATFLAVDVVGLQVRLRDLGAIRAFPRTLFTRRIFYSDALEDGSWIRLRSEGTRSTLTLKRVTDGTRIDGTTEIETEVTDPAAMAEILTRLGLREASYQENYREEWRSGEIAFDFDTWPYLPTFLEIEGPDEASVRDAASTLGLDYTQARFGSVDSIYLSELGRDVTAEAILTFADQDGNEALAADGPVG